MIINRGILDRFVALRRLVNLFGSNNVLSIICKKVCRVKVVNTFTLYTFFNDDLKNTPLVFPIFIFCWVCCSMSS